jgi:hypothetical protein
MNSDSSPRVSGWKYGNTVSTSVSCWESGASLPDHARGPDHIGEGASGAVLKTAGDGDELIGASVQFVADVLDQEIEVAVAADHTGQHLARDGFRGGEYHGFDAAHPFAPAGLRRQVVELDVEFHLAFGAPPHGLKPIQPKRVAARDSAISRSIYRASLEGRRISPLARWPAWRHI